MGNNLPLYKNTVVDQLLTEKFLMSGVSSGVTSTRTIRWLFFNHENKS